MGESKMKIKSPISHKDEAKALCEAGANELFCGIEPLGWRKKYKNFCINQRSSAANFSNLRNLEETVSIAHRYKTKIHIAINAFFYLEEQYIVAADIVRDVLAIGADGIIFADIGLLSFLEKKILRDKDVIAGCDTVIFNHQAADFYKKLGVTRIVFPRSMTVEEIGKTAGYDKTLEYEVFIINDLCFFEDGFCAYCKEQSGNVQKEGNLRNGLFLFSSSRIPPLRGFGGGCRSNFSKQRIYLNGFRQKSLKPFSFWDKKHIDGCGACAIYDFKKIGITSLKVLDRNMPLEEKVKSTAFIKKCLEFLAAKTISSADYTVKCRNLFKETFKGKCNFYDCYYSRKSPVHY